jgi:histidyl-tRNA synthetase
LRVLDCKVPACREALTGAPSLLDHLCSDCRQDFETVQETLDRREIPYVADKRLVRGLDYYARTTFEIQTTALGAQSAVAGGGRYDGLVKLLDGPDQPATGFAIGLDRLAEIVSSREAVPPKKPDLFVTALGADSQREAFQWICDLGLAGIHAEMDFSDRSLKSQMKRADRLGAPRVLIVGDDELEKGTAVLRNMKTKEQVSIPLDELVVKLKENINL